MISRWPERASHRLRGDGQMTVDESTREGKVVTDSAEKAAKRRSLNKKILIGVGVVFALLVVIGVVAGEDETESTDAAGAGTSEQAPVDVAEAGESVPEGDTTVTVAETAPEPPSGVGVHTSPGSEGEIVFAEFDIADSLTKGMIRRGAQDKTVEILEFARDAYPDAARIFVQGRFR